MYNKAPGRCWTRASLRSWPALLSMYPSIDLYVYLSIYLCMYVYIYIYIYICMYVYVCVNLPIYFYVFTYDKPVRQVLDGCLSSLLACLARAADALDCPVPSHALSHVPGHAVGCHVPDHAPANREEARDRAERGGTAFGEERVQLCCRWVP